MNDSGSWGESASPEFLVDSVFWFYAVFNALGLAWQITRIDCMIADILFTCTEPEFISTNPNYTIFKKSCNQPFSTLLTSQGVVGLQY